MTVIDDGFLELKEDFVLELRFDPYITVPSSGVQLFPNVSTIYIQDSDGKHTIRCSIHVAESIHNVVGQEEYDTSSTSTHIMQDQS